MEKEEKDYLNFEINENGKTYIKSYNKERKIEVDIFFDENNDTNIMGDVIKTMSKMFVEELLNERE